MKKVLMFAAASMLLASCGGGGGRPTFGDNEFPVVTVGTSSTTMQSTYPANIKGVQDVEIHPKVQGFITQINVKEGQTVSAGQVLFVLDNATYQAQVRQAQAQVNTATASLNTAKLTYENSQKLHASGVIGDYEREESCRRCRRFSALQGGYPRECRQYLDDRFQHQFYGSLFLNDREGYARHG